MTQSIFCSACGATVTYGRLSCQECGELLASVAGARRAPDVLHDADPRDVASPPATTTAASDVADAEPIVVSGAGRWAADEDGFEALLAESAGSAAAHVSQSATFAAAAATGGPSTAGAALPGAYLPPSPVPTPSPSAAGTVSPAVPAPARSWAGHGANGAEPSADAGPERTADDAGGSLLAGERVGDFVGWLAVAGAALALVGMVLPWSSLTVIGAGGVGYFDRWGIAGPGHLLVLVAIIGVLGLALVRDRVPAWLGVGLPGLALGGLLLGLTWPYLIGPLGGQLGSWAVALGGVLLMGAGVAAIVVDRHGRGDQAV